MIASRRPALTPPSLYYNTRSFILGCWVVGWFSVGRSVGWALALCVCVTHYMFTLSACYYDNTQTHILYCNDKPFLFFCISIPLWQRASTLFCSCSLLFLYAAPRRLQGDVCSESEKESLIMAGESIFLSPSRGLAVRSAKKSARICVLFLWWDFLVRDGLKAGQICAAVFSIDSFGCWRAVFVGTECFGCLDELEMDFTFSWTCISIRWNMSRGYNLLKCWDFFFINEILCKSKTFINNI